ncbi:hypothetical protein [Campylobacter devanensis]|uniref:hypothetical protein n=1 Tax=Campylobacter devanensis TaxID=3161138 RepID=UPI001F21B44F|nr:hypothetical protein [Campylobacter sp. P155]
MLPKSYLANRPAPMYLLSPSPTLLAAMLMVLASLVLPSRVTGFLVFMFRVFHYY